MIRNVLLISEDSIKENSAINKNLFGEYLRPAIMYAQEAGLRPVIGECLYDKLCDMVADGTIRLDISSHYKNLLDNYINPYLLHKTLSEVLINIQVKAVNLGAVTSNDEHSTTLSQRDFELLRNKESEISDFYLKIMQDFLKQNRGLFPELSDCCSTIKPNLNSSDNSSGLWLGGLRGRKITTTGACAGSCGSDEHSNEDYNDGYRDGYVKGKEDGKEQGIEEAREKMTKGKFTENGTYFNEYGWNVAEVEVDVNPPLQEKSVEITSNGQTRIEPDNDFYGLKAVSIAVNVPDKEFITKELNIENNGVFIAKNEGFDGYSKVTVNVDTGASEEDLERKYQEGYDAGKEEGEATGRQKGIDEQKSKLAETTITTNGEYEREDGWKKVTVNVPQGAEINNQNKRIEITENKETTVTFDEGYTGLGKVDISVNVPQGDNGCELLSKRIYDQLTSIPECALTLKQIPEYAFAGCGNMTECNIPDHIEQIHYMSFYGNGFKEVIIPANVKKIYGVSFVSNKTEAIHFYGAPDLDDGCIYNQSTLAPNLKLRDIYLHGGLPEIHNNPFGNFRDSNESGMVSYHGTVHVPVDSQLDYQSWVDKAFGGVDYRADWNIVYDIGAVVTPSDDDDTDYYIEIANVHLKDGVKQYVSNGNNKPNLRVDGEIKDLVKEISEGKTKYYFIPKKESHSTLRYYFESNSAFINCRGIVFGIDNDAYINLCGKILYLGEWNFGETNLKKIVFDDARYLQIQDWCFYDCKNLEEIEIKTKGLMFEEYSLGGCNNLKKIYVGDMGITSSTTFNSETFIIRKESCQSFADNGVLISSTGNNIEEPLNKTTWWPVLKEKGWTLQYE